MFRLREPGKRERCSSSCRWALHPMPNSSEDSSGVPQRRQITAEQSPQVSGSLTSTAQTGQYNAAVGLRAYGGGFGGISMSMNYEHETVTQFSDALSTRYSAGFRRIRLPSVGGSEKGNCQTLSVIRTPTIKSSRSFHGPIHLLLVAKKIQPWASGLPGFSVADSRLCVLRNSMNSAASFSYSRKRAVFSSVSLGFFLIWRSVSKTSVSTSFCSLLESSVGSM